MEMKVKVFFVFFFLFMAPLFGATAAHRNRTVKKHLRRLNKPSLKSIKSPDGDIIDCVHISHQPAFDHPLLQNHTIQMRPSYYPKGALSEKMGPKKPMSQLWHVNGRCPVGTVPIRRTSREDLMRASSVSKYGRKNMKSIPKQTSASAALKPNIVDQIVNHNYNEQALAFVDGGGYGGKYYGVEANLNVWGPKVQATNEFSSSQLWILGDTHHTQNLNSIEVGWQVYPELYGDNNPRFFTYWTSDYYRTTGCFNLLCSGFVQTNNDITMGGTIDPFSSYDSDQYETTIRVWKDLGKEGHWWMKIDGDEIGYWPAVLFNQLKDRAAKIAWGGEVLNFGYDRPEEAHTTTQMGSGSFAEEGYGKASYIRSVQVMDSTNYLTDPKDAYATKLGKDCYNVQLGHGDYMGSYIYFGGPGRNHKCP